MDDADAPPRAVSLLLIIVLSCVIVGGATDIWLDGSAAWLTAHTVVELALVTLSAGCLVYFWRLWRTSEVTTRAVRDALAASERAVEVRQRERDEWRASAEASLSGLANAIDRQFSRWELTPAERDVAIGLLKGLGHKQIAGASSRSERTVRQHAVSVYGKAGVAGRAELAAYFLQDLSLPRSSEVR